MQYTSASLANHEHPQQLTPPPKDLLSMYENEVAYEVPAITLVASDKKETHASLKPMALRDLVLRTGRWSELVTQSSANEIFYQPEWILSAIKSFFPQRPLVCLQVWHGEQLAGLLPLIQAKSFFKGIPAQTLRSPTTVHSCRFDMPCDTHDADAIVALCWEQIRSNSEWEVLQFDDVPRGGFLTALQEYAHQDGYICHSWPTLRSPFLRLERDEDVLGHCPKEHKSFRSRLKSKRKKLAELGPLTLRAEASLNRQTLESFLRIESSGWKGKAGTSIASHDEVTQFYQSIAAEFAPLGKLRIYSLCVGEKPIAMHFGLCAGKTYYAPKVAYDESYAKYSPGQILVYLVLEDLHKAGVQRYDFLGPKSPWKSIWTDEVREHATLYIIRPSLRAFSLYSPALRGAAALRSARLRIRGDPQA